MLHSVTSSKFDKFHLYNGLAAARGGQEQENEQNSEEQWEHRGEQTSAHKLSFIFYILNCHYSLNL